MKKHLLFILLFLIAFTFLVAKMITYASTSSNIIYLDAGHGGFDGGATSKNSTILEKNITLKATKYLQNYLEKTGFIVYLTRKSDQALSTNKKNDIYKRVDLINDSKCILFISIHANSYPNSKVKGAQVFYHKDEKNILLANKITKYIHQQDISNNRCAKEIKGKYLLDHTKKTGCLVELGFLTNDEDLKKLTDEQQLREIVFMIYLGILDYLEEINE